MICDNNNSHNNNNSQKKTAKFTRTSQMATKPWQEQQQWTKKQQQLCSLTDIILHKISLTRLLITQYLSNAEKYHQSDKKLPCPGGIGIQ